MRERTGHRRQHFRRPSRVADVTRDAAHRNPVLWRRRMQHARRRPRTRERRADCARSLSEIAASPEVDSARRHAPQGCAPRIPHPIILRCRVPVSKPQEAPLSFAGRRGRRSRQSGRRPRPVPLHASLRPTPRVLAARRAMKLRTRGRFNLKRLCRALADRVRGTDFDRAVRRAVREDRREFVFGWNRGLGDVALGLVPLFARIRARCPGSRITVYTRADLAQMFGLTDADAVFTVPDAVRGKPIDPAAAAAALGHALPPRRHGVRRSGSHPLARRPAPGLSAGRCAGIPPGTRWPIASCPRATTHTIVGAHVHSETAAALRLREGLAGSVVARAARALCREQRRAVGAVRACGDRGVPAAERARPARADRPARAACGDPPPLPRAGRAGQRHPHRRLLPRCPVSARHRVAVVGSAAGRAEAGMPVAQSRPAPHGARRCRARTCAASPSTRCSRRSMPRSRAPRRRPRDGARSRRPRLPAREARAPPPAPGSSGCCSSACSCGRRCTSCWSR